MSLKIWKDRVSLEYKKLIAFQKIEQQKEIINAWKSNWSKIDSHISFEDKRFHIHWGKLNLIADGKTYDLKPIKSIPRMNNFVLAKSNERSREENKLYNIPVTNNDEDTNFISELIESYGQVYNENEINLMDDKLFIKLVKVLQEKYVSRNMQNKLFPPAIIFEAISTYFSNKLTSKALMEKYFQLTTNCNDNVDSNDTGNPLNFTKLFCRRCYIYGCTLHDNMMSNSGRHHVLSSNFFGQPKTPCSENCFLLRQNLGNNEINFENSQNRQHSETNVKPCNTKPFISKQLQTQHLRPYSSRSLKSSKQRKQKNSNQLKLKSCPSQQLQKSLDSEPCSSNQMEPYSLQQNRERLESTGLQKIPNSNDFITNELHRIETEPCTSRKAKEIRQQYDVLQQHHQNLNQSSQQQQMDFIKIETESNTNEEWDVKDLEFFETLSNIFHDNYCLIAKTMMVKSCQQVYDLALEKKAELIPKNFLSTSRPKKIMTNKKCKVLHNKYLMAKKNPGTSRIHHYTPCNHADNSACNADCICVKSENFCEKFCGCNSECPFRFPGCKCKGQCNSNRCICFSARRECDPDLCMNCGAANFDLKEVVCKNINIQRRLDKPLLLAPSDVAGWGIFLKNAAQENEFISEYCGEIITQQEANRRGQVYDKIKCSYLFDLNEEFVIDATRKGSKIRFANHSNNGNCYAKVLMVNGDHRIGIFAKRNILPGEEIFFNYNYGTNERLKFISIEK